MQKRLRVFAGPNGSGKSTIIPMVVREIEERRLGVFVNSDEIEKKLKEEGRLDFNPYELTVNQEEITDFFLKSRFSPVFRNELDLWSKISISDNKFEFKGKIDSYLSADLADFIRNCLLKEGISFTFETVMSHPGKLDFLAKANDEGYKVYLYYIATEDPKINISRVQLRVLKNGHPVSDEAIERRYFKSLQNLRAAVKQSYRSYIFDNSGSLAELVAEVSAGKEIDIIDPERVPEWVANYLLQLEN